MQDPFRNLNQAESNLNRLGNQLQNPGQAARQKANMIQRQINQGTANMISALCYVTGVMCLVVAGRKQWKQDQIIRYHVAHARVLWLIMLITACSIIGIPVAVLTYLGGFYLASEAMAGRQPRVPFLSQFIMQRGWM